MLGTMQRLASLNPQSRRAETFDAGSHPDQAIAEIDDLWLARGVLDQRLSPREHRRHQGVMGRADRDLGEFDTVTGEPPWSPGDHVTAFELDFGAERLKRREMEVDGRVPMAQPPAERLARPQRATSGASTQKLARMRATIS